jgi:phosphatidylserine/phosphatidylglycerophosphate/cardiolipin synthase-like enzyme
MSEIARLSGLIEELTDLLPINVVTDLASEFVGCPRPDYQRARRQISSYVREPHALSLFNSLINLWEAEHPHLTNDAVGLALLSSSASSARQREKSEVELVWTGPTKHEVNLRQTENALLTLINKASSGIHILSFAIYKAEVILDALSRSLDRGVTVSIYLETPIHSENKVKFDPREILDAKLNNKASIFVWPLEKRTRSSSGHHGSLHAKAAVIDSEFVFVSSANLTDYAMTLNIELGVILRDTNAAKKIETQLQLMIESDDFISV